MPCHQTALDWTHLQVAQCVRWPRLGALLESESKRLQRLPETKTHQNYNMNKVQLVRVEDPPFFFELFGPRPNHQAVMASKKFPVRLARTSANLIGPRIPR